MAAEHPDQREVLRRALAPGNDCLPLETLELCLHSSTAPPELVNHLESCAYCRSELDLLRSFETAPRDAAEAQAVRLVTARLQSPWLPARAMNAPAPVTREPWWKNLLQARWLSPAALAAAMLLAIAVGVQWRHGAAPSLQAPRGPEQDVLRSGSLDVMAPSGDIGQVPQQVRWRPVPNAVLYRVSLLEVDHAEVWSASTSESLLDIPRQVQARIVPSKTLLVQVIALDNAGRKLAESEFVRFRFLQNVYPR